MDHQGQIFVAKDRLKVLHHRQHAGLVVTIEEHQRARQAHAWISPAMGDQAAKPGFSMLPLSNGDQRPTREHRADGRKGQRFYADLMIRNLQSSMFQDFSPLRYMSLKLLLLLVFYLAFRYYPYSSLRYFILSFATYVIPRT